MRIIDFFLVFPHLLNEIKPFPNEFKQFKSIIAEIPEQYEHISNPRRVLYDMEGIQNTCYANLAAKNLLTPTNLSKNILERSNAALPDVIITLIHNDLRQEFEWFKFIINILPDFELSQKNGLKSRTNLMEYRYNNNV